MIHLEPVHHNGQWPTIYLQIVMTQAQPTPPRSSPLKPMLFIGIVLISLAVVVAVSKFRTPPELVPWQNDYPKALAQARAANKPLLLYFTAEWCGPCQDMRRYVWSDPQVADAIKPFIPVRIDIDTQPQFAGQYKAEEGIPLFVVLDTSGNEIRRVVGAMPAEEFIDRVTRK